MTSNARKILTSWKLTAFLVLMVAVFSFIGRKMSLITYIHGSQITYDELKFIKLSRKLMDDPLYYELRGSVIEEYDDWDEIPLETRNTFSKHPPLFPALNAVLFKLFGEKFSSVLHVPPFFGFLAVIGMFFLGTMAGGRRCGLLSAFFVAISPISMIGYQKFWIDGPLSALILLSMCFYIWGLKSGREINYLIGGLLSVIAVMTKYPGLMVCIVMSLYALLFAPQLLRRWRFVLSIFLPPAVLLAWWSYLSPVYGSDFPGSNLRQLVGYLPIRHITMTQVTICVLVSFILFLGLGRIRERIGRSEKVKLLISKSIPVAEKALYLAGILLFILITPSILRAIIATDIPTNSQVHGLFNDSPYWHYFGRMVEFFPLYLCGFWLVFCHRQTESPAVTVIKLAAILPTLFFVYHQNYQCRYIMPVIPFWLVLSAFGWDKLLQISRASSRVWQRRLVPSGLLIFMLYAIFQTLMINARWTNHNYMCYF